MTCISSTKNSVGISLPMGVKASSTFNSSFNDVVWTPSQDKQLIRTVQKFGFNWNMVAKSQVCFNEFRYVYDSQSASRHKIFRQRIDLPAVSDVGKYIEGPSFAAGNRKDQAIVVFVPETALLGKQPDDTRNLQGMKQ
jgi:hypothetical protein